LCCLEESNGANLVLDLSVQLKDAENQKLMASRKYDLKYHKRKRRLRQGPKLKQKLKLKLPAGEQ